MPRSSKYECPEAAWGQHGLTDKYGRCPYCGRKVQAAIARPDSYDMSELTDAYDTYYNNDYDGPEAHV